MTSFWLEFDHNGQTQNATFAGHSITVGRDRGSDFILDHPTVSRQHALIVDEGGGTYRLVVLSRGGLTAVDGQPVNGEVTLWDGAMLTLGKHSVRFRAPDSTTRPPRGAAAGPTAPVPAGGGFGQTPAAGGNFGHQGAAGSFGQQGAPGGFGQTPVGGGFGQTPAGGGFGQQGAPGGFGQTPAAGGGFGQHAAPGGFGSPVPNGSPEPGAKPASDDPAGIVSWDEIAASDAALADADEDVQASDYQRIQAASAKAGAAPGETNPVVVIGGVVIAVGMLAFTFLGGGDGGAASGPEKVNYSELPPVQLEVNCLDQTDCMRQAQESYRIATDLLDKKDVENRNLFDGYKRLLEVQAYMEKGGVTEFPAEMGEWTVLHEGSRAALDDYFRNFRASFHSAMQRDRYLEMAETLNKVEAFFPDSTSRENRWASDMELKMKAEGNYPRTMR
ncbi:hypothetical protein DL240_00960 [Lujinxingia litoralis]|uniref:FHA domain-containing protein n=1 Tax=Lujinxingia litoralis TaxID=2211119 RepID=A0A328C9M4_9DELT|nr:FHA domain-containing protein [Lujinxingia litoralis]RAL24812.1 hypothetical protein DL240_00960 [Lujinxingia litoralis]